MGNKNTETWTAMIKNDIPKKLVSFYDSDVISDIKLQEAIIKEVNNPDINLAAFSKGLPIDTFITYYLEKLSTGSMQTKDALALVKERKRQLKKNIYRSIREEMGEIGLSPRNPMFLEKDSEMYRSLSRFTSDNNYKQYANEQEFKKYKYDLITSWYKTTGSLCIDFEYFAYLSPKSRARGFLFDMECFIYTYIAEKNLTDLSNDGYVKKVPEAVFSAPMFGFRQSDMNIEAEVEEDVVSAVENYEQGNVKIKTTVGKAHMAGRTIGTVLAELRKSSISSHDVQALDTVDFELLTTICSAITGDNIASGKIIFPLKTLYKNFYGEDKQIRMRDYKNLLAHVEKLSKFTMDVVREDNELGMVVRDIFHFFDVRYFMHYTKNGKSDSREFFMQDFEQYMDKFDIGSAILEFYVGNTIRDAWQADNIMKVCSDIYNELDNSKEKALLFMLEDKRIKAYPNLETTITMEEINYGLRFSKGERVKSVVSGILDKFKQKGSVVFDYRFELDNIVVRFKQLTQSEMQIYDITPQDTRFIVDTYL